MTKKKKNKKNMTFSIIFLLLGIIIICLSFIINNANGIRPLLWILGTITLIVDLFKTYKLKLHNVLIIFIILFTVSAIGDVIVVTTFKRIPLFAYNIIHSNNTTVYNGIGIRVWQCDKNNNKDLIVDLFYQKGYMCDAEDIDAIDSNAFLNSVVNNYEEYRNRYIKIEGKISKKTGRNYIEMQPYETTDITLNGYVTFADNITLKILFKNPEEELDNYDIYDDITIVGIIKNLDDLDGKYVIYMYDSKVVSSVNLNEYSIIVMKEEKCSNDKMTLFTNETNNIYSYCIDEIFVTYPDDKKYELSSVLSSNKINITELYKKPKSVKNHEENNSKIYVLDDYSVLVCDPTISKDIIIGHKKMNFTDVECTNTVPVDE